MCICPSPQHNRLQTYLPVLIETGNARLTIYQVGGFAAAGLSFAS